MREDGRVMREGFAADFVALAIPNLKIQVSENVAKPLNLGGFPWFSQNLPMFSICLSSAFPITLDFAAPAKRRVHWTRAHKPPQRPEPIGSSPGSQRPWICGD